ncbi:MAG: hypothetical protein DRP01_00735 [Archaeoglobales archaeon]|nr:MAG: hypothetical protein DRP01_00735 [Archaeoglobales archaeon]
MIIVLEITWKCPHKCRHCSLRSLISKTSKIELSYREVEKVDRILRSSFRDINYIISGGEPTLHRELPEIIDLLRSKGSHVTLATSAFSIDMLKRCNADLYEVSVDYFKDRHDRYRGTRGLFSKVEEFVKLNRPTVIRMTYLGDNDRDIIDVIDYYYKYDNLFFLISRAVPNTEIPQSLKEEIERLFGLDKIQIGEESCPAGRTLFVVTPTLDILACPFYRLKLGKIDLERGDLYVKFIDLPVDVFLCTSKV